MGPGVWSGVFSCFSPHGFVSTSSSLNNPPRSSGAPKPVPRRAFAVIYDSQSNRTWEAAADLSSSRVASWKEIPGAQPPITGEDSGRADRIARSDPRFLQAMRARGIRDVNRVFSMAWSAGYFALPETDKGRIVRAVPYYGGAGKNYYAHPIEGLVAHVNLTTGKVIDLLDTDRNVPVPRKWRTFSAPTGPFRAGPAPLDITQPSGPGFQITDGEVRWQKWRFRYGLHPREGLVLYTVGYEDGGRVRPVMYRGVALGDGGALRRPGRLLVLPQ